MAELQPFRLTANGQADAFVSERPIARRLEWLNVVSEGTDAALVTVCDGTGTGSPVKLTVRHNAAAITFLGPFLGLGFTSGIYVTVSAGTVEGAYL